MKTQLTTNLWLHEFACKCNHPDCRHKEAVDFRLVTELQRAVDYFSDQFSSPARILITSGNRCPTHNTDIGGANFSAHTLLCAADFRIQVELGSGWLNVPFQEVYNYFNSKFPATCGLGIYSNHIHFDTRQRKWRQP